MKIHLIPRVGQHSRNRRVHETIISLLLGVLLVLSPGLASAQESDLLIGGNFDDEFYNTPVGLIAAGWGWFTNEGQANYTFANDTGDAVVVAGEESQLIRIDTYNLFPADRDRYAGLYQTVRVVEGAEYTLDMQGLIRSTRMVGDPWRYIVEVGWNEGRDADWTTVDNWIDTGWYDYYPMDDPGDFSRFTLDLTPTDEFITLYIRVWKKWGHANEELRVNLDTISLTGPEPPPFAVSGESGAGG
jgi:hypothetical protein